MTNREAADLVQEHSKHERRVWHMMGHVSIVEAATEHAFEDKKREGKWNCGCLSFCVIARRCSACCMVIAERLEETT